MPRCQHASCGEHSLPQMRHETSPQTNQQQCVGLAVLHAQEAQQRQPPPQAKTYYQQFEEESKKLWDKVKDLAAVNEELQAEHQELAARVSSLEHRVQALEVSTWLVEVMDLLLQFERAVVPCVDRSETYATCLDVRNPDVQQNWARASGGASLQVLTSLGRALHLSTPPRKGTSPLNRSNTYHWIECLAQHAGLKAQDATALVHCAVTWLKIV